MKQKVWSTYIITSQTKHKWKNTESDLCDSKLKGKKTKLVVYLIIVTNWHISITTYITAPHQFYYYITQKFLFYTEISHDIDIFQRKMYHNHNRQHPY